MIIAIDAGGTKTLVTTFTDAGVMGEVHRLATSKDTMTFVDDIAKIVDTLAPQASDTIVVAAAGLIDSSNGVIKHSPNLGWHGFELRAVLSERYTSRIYLQNDATIGALGATLALSAVPRCALYVALGTGIGGGIVLNGHLEPALTQVEIGHMMFQMPDGLKDWESFASGKAIARDFGAEAAQINDASAWQAIASRLGVGLRVLIPALQPDVILIGGGVGAQFNKFGALLNQQLREELPHYISLPPILQATNPEEAVLKGCYHYARTFDKIAAA
ncbi:MAG TPA: ROK family protein [Candidatus Acidoferrum sp.]|nr:ROK family protein [Candidatus Acidoferrum sp.]